MLSAVDRRVLPVFNGALCSCFYNKHYNAFIPASIVVGGAALQPIGKCYRRREGPLKGWMAMLRPRWEHKQGEGGGVCVCPNPKNP